MKKYSLILLILSGTTLWSCTGVMKEKVVKQDEKQAEQDKLAQTDPLPSWNNTPARQAIIDFVTKVTVPGGEDYIPDADRIATFDNDGTLWCEQPLYFEFVYSLDALKAIVREKPELQKKPELKALAAGDPTLLLKGGEKGMLEAFAISHVAVLPDEFDRMATAWLDTATHKRFNRKYTELIYQPMVELLLYLQDHHFKTFIVSGGSSMFIRQFSEDLYGIPAERVIGTMFKASWVAESKSVIYTPELWHNDDNVGKPEGILQLIGRKPVLAFGNSDGDRQMLEWTATDNPYASLSLLLHHTDAEREYAYDRDSRIGKLDEALTEGKANGWIIVDMKKDFNKIFSFE